EKPRRNDLAADARDRQQPVHRFAQPYRPAEEQPGAAPSARQQDLPGARVERDRDEMEKARPEDADARGGEGGEHRPDAVPDKEAGGENEPGEGAEGRGADHDAVAASAE